MMRLHAITCYFLKKKQHDISVSHMHKSNHEGLRSFDYSVRKLDVGLDLRILHWTLTRENLSSGFPSRTCSATETS